MTCGSPLKQARTRHPACCARARSGRSSRVGHLSQTCVAAFLSRRAPAVAPHGRAAHGARLSCLSGDFERRSRAPSRQAHRLLPHAQPMASCGWPHRSAPRHLSVRLGSRYPRTARADVSGAPGTRASDRATALRAAPRKDRGAAARLLPGGTTGAPGRPRLAGPGLAMVQRRRAIPNESARPRGPHTVPRIGCLAGTRQRIVTECRRESTAIPHARAGLRADPARREGCRRARAPRPC